MSIKINRPLMVQDFDGNPEAFAEAHNYMQALNELDKIAQAILSIAWSGHESQGRQSQVGNRDLRTVAVVAVNQTLIVAGNAISWEQRLRSTIRRADARGTQNWVYYAPQTQYSPDYSTLIFGGADAIRYELGRLGEQRQVLFPDECRKDFNFHAEMALLQYMSMHNLHPDGDEIGVSKPCCVRCARVLDECRIRYSTYHTSPIGDWTPPNLRVGWR
jgi:hypothetical protein